MAKSADAFRTISEVADWLGTPAHVLRFWESKFTQVKPVKRAGGRRYYRPSDMQLIGGIKKLLHDDGMTIKGVQKILREQGVKHVAALSQPLDDLTLAEAEELTIDLTPADAPGTVLSFDREEPKPGETPAAGEAETVPEEAGFALEEAAEETEDTASATPVAEPVDADAVPPLLWDSEEDWVAPQNAPEADEDLDQTEDAGIPPYAPEGDLFDIESPAPPGGIEADQDLLSAATASLLRETETGEPEPSPVPSEEPEPEEATTEPTPNPFEVGVPDDPADDIAAEPGVLPRLIRHTAPLSQDQVATLVSIREELANVRARLGRPRQS